MANATVRRRRLGAELRRLREANDMTCEQVGKLMECSHSKISRIELGRGGIKLKEVRELLDIYQVEDRERRDHLVELARPDKRKVWWTKYQDKLPAPYYSYIDLEAAASTIMVFEPLVVHGLLQTEDYARAMVQGGLKEISEEEIESRVSARMLRQEHHRDRLAKDDVPRLWVILDESVLYREVGGRDVLKAQLKRILDEAKQPKTTVQVIQFSAGAHPGTLGSFTVLGFEPGDPNAVYVETISGDLYVERDQDIDACTMAFEHLRAKALSPEDSEKRIREVIAGLS